MATLSTMGMVALAALLWGTNFSLAIPVVADLHPLVAAAARFAIAAAAMLAVATARGERVPLLRHARTYALLGGLGIAGFNLPFFFAMQHASAVNGALIMATNPLVTAVLAGLLLRERPTRRQLLALPVALAGVAVVVLAAQPGRLGIGWGDALIMVANLAWATYTVAGKRLMPPAPAIANTAGIMVMGAAILTLVAVAADAPVAVPGPKASLALLGLALGGSALAYLCWNAGLARLGAGRTALFLNLVPVTTMAIEAALGTPPTALQLAGGALVLAAVSAATMPARRRPERTEPIPDPVAAERFGLAPGRAD